MDAFNAKNSDHQERFRSQDLNFRYIYISEKQFQNDRIYRFGHSHGKNLKYPKVHVTNVVRLQYNHNTFY